MAHLGLILIVKLSAIRRSELRECLEAAGYSVIEASDGASALALVRTQRPDLIVQDLVLPDMDGLELARLLHAKLGDVAVPILGVSGFLSRLNEARAMKSGVAQVLVKPVDLFQFLDVVRIHLAPPDPIELADEEHARRALWQLEHGAHRTEHLVQRSPLQATQLAVLAGVAEALAKNRDLDGVLGEVLAACLEMAGISKGALCLETAGRLELEHQIGFSEDEVPRLRELFHCRTALAKLATRGSVVLVPSPAVPIELGDSLLAEAGVSSVLLVPVSWAGTTYGLMILGSTTADLAGEDARAFARVLGTQMGLAIGLAQSFARLATSEQRYRTLAENASDAISVLTLDGTICEVNRRVTQILGYSADQLVGRQAREFAAPGLDADSDDYSQSLAIGGQSPPIGIRKADGSIVLAEFSLTPVQVGSEQLVLAIGRDVTEEIHARAQLMTADRMSSIGTLAAGLAHEINNPLAAVMGNLEVAIDELAKLGATAGMPVGLKDVQDALDDARAGTDRVRDIVKDLRIFSRASEGGRLSVVDTERVLESTLRMAATEIRHRARLVKHYGRVPCVMANESRLGQVFLNLVVNAAQAIPEGRADVNEIVVTTSTDPSGGVVVEIRDTGPGMPPEILRSLFTPFFTTKPIGVGTGLGLTICKRIVTELGGEITAESRVGHGTSFSVVLPAALEQVERKPVRAIAIPATRRGRILLVDDDESLGKAVKRSLSGDHDVTVMSSAREALTCIEGGQRFDVILCDMMMPVLTGMDFYEQLHRTVTDQASRIIFLTGGAFTVSAREFLDHVPNTSMEKPFAIRDLRAAVNERVR